jgi:hypothetical protein
LSRPYEELHAENQRLREALRQAPVPFREQESHYHRADWDEDYEAWFRDNAADDVV